MFNEQQEAHLGEVVAGHLLRSFRVTNDEQITSYLQRVGERLLKHLPSPGLKFQYFLIDLPEAAALALPGGRVYVSPKLVALARSEDELAGVLAHEFGHLVTHQSAISMTRMMLRLLGSSQVTDRRDIEEKYHRLMENWRRLPRGSRRERKRHQEEQMMADQIALHAVISAGFGGEAFIDIFDRITGAEGKTGSWLTDLFGTTKPEARRLREMINVVKSLPPSCVEPRPASPSGEFERWRTAVVAYSGWDRQEILHDVLAKTKLEPPLRGEIHHLRFSPDGRHLLAQDEGTIFVLSRDPFKALFQIDAPGVSPAQFSPDSKLVVFRDSDLRVEVWDIAAGKRKGAYELVVQKGCLQSELAPDGKSLACLSTDFELLILDVASGAAISRTKIPYVEQASRGTLISMLAAVVIGSADVSDFQWMHMGFSPDARYFLGAFGNTVVAFEISERNTIPLPRPIKSGLSGGFVFLGPDRLLVRPAFDTEASRIMRFPSGEKLSKVTLGRGRLSAPARGEYVLLRPVEDYPVGVIDLAKNKGLFANKQAALDLYDQVFVGELRSGELGLFDTSTRKLTSQANLPGGLLGGLRVAVVSPDLKWLAVSQGSRGAVWDLSSGRRLYHLRRFDGAYFSEGGVLYADFPKYEESERRIGKMSLAYEATAQGPRIDEQYAQQHGRFLVATKPQNPQGVSLQTSLGVIGGGFDRDVAREIRDATSGATLWSKRFPKEAPSVYVAPHEGTMVLTWGATTDAVEEEARANPEVEERLRGPKPEKDDYLVEVVEAQTGKFLGAFTVRTGKGSFRIVRARAVGDWVFIHDTLDRALVYSLSSGVEKGKCFGVPVAMSAASNLLAVTQRGGHLSIYDLASTENLDQFVFSSSVLQAQFSTDGKRLLVLTADQTAHTLDLSSSAQTALASALVQ